VPALTDMTRLSLMDIDEERLRTSAVVAGKIAGRLDSRAPVEATLDRRVALDGADYVITSFQVGGYRPATVVDFEVPKRFGLRQTIADTLGVGGIMRGLRTVPVLLDGRRADARRDRPARRRAPASAWRLDPLAGGDGLAWVACRVR
jgi:alpha-galactosidase